MTVAHPFNAQRAQVRFRIFIDFPPGLEDAFSRLYRSGRVHLPRYRKENISAVYDVAVMTTLTD